MEPLADRVLALTLADEGMPVQGVPSEFGKLHVKLSIEMPSSLSREERAFVQVAVDQRGAPREDRPQTGHQEENIEDLNECNACNFLCASRARTSEGSIPDLRMITISAGAATSENKTLQGLATTCSCQCLAGRPKTSWRKLRVCGLTDSHTTE